MYIFTTLEMYDSGYNNTLDGEKLVIQRNSDKRKIIQWRWLKEILGRIMKVEASKFSSSIYFLVVSALCGKCMKLGRKTLSTCLIINR